jgi:proteasome alpha subunit
MYPQGPAAYDRAITVFSPDGRLFQVEYAREAVKRGTTACGLIYADGILLAVDKSISSRLIVPRSIEKIFQIDEHIGIATSGLVADARRLIEEARMKAQRHRLAYNEPISVQALTREICDTEQAYTQYGGARPFGTALLIAGVNDKPYLFETDPSGAFTEYVATAIGTGKADVEKLFEKEYKEDMAKKDAIELVLKGLSIVAERKLQSEYLEVINIDVKNKYREMKREDIAKHLANVGDTSGEKKSTEPQ